MNRSDTIAIAIAVALFVAVAGCGTAMTRESFIPIPDHPPVPNARADVRGAPRQANRIPPAEHAAIVGQVIQRFYRPMMQQARWIDPRPLAHERTRHADTLMAVNPTWAIAIVDAARVGRVCPLGEANRRCHGLAGGVLRFSHAYAVGAGAVAADSALVYVRYAPLSAGVESEMEFLVARAQGAGGGRWRVLSKRTLPPITDGQPRSAVVDAREALDSLLATDRAFAMAAKTTDLASAIAATFVDNVYLQAPGGFVRGRDSAMKVMSTAGNAQLRVEWVPVRGGVSSDGQQGFTMGYMTTTRPDGVALPGKYVAYWVRAESGWRVAAYKRAPRPAGDVSLAMIDPSLPVPALAPGDESTVQRYADELSLAEHAFSREAGEIGLGPAFAKWGAPDALHAGGPNDVAFVRGPEAIARSVSAGMSPGVAISWAPERVIVSSTGDLGVSIGTIRITTPPSAGEGASTRSVPFFTVWKRAYPADPWRYVAE